MPRKKSTKKSEAAEMLKHYNEVEKMLSNIPEAKAPKTYKTLSARDKEKFVKMLKHLLHEFMDSYILVGFSVDGVETAIVETHGTPLETRALNDLAYEFFTLYFGNVIGPTLLQPPEDSDELE